MSAIASRIKSAGQTNSMELILFPLFIIFIIGAIFNAMNSSGLQATGYTSQTTTAICYLGQPNCSPIINPPPTGCVANPQNCNASSITSFSLLNPSSPFTRVLGGDIAGFVSSFSNGNGQSNSLEALSLCITFQAGTSFTFLECSASSWSILGAPAQPYPIVACPFTVGGFANAFNATASTKPYTTNSGQANVTQWTITGCIPVNNLSNSASNKTATLLMQADYNGVNGSITLTKYQSGIVDIANNGGGMQIIAFFIGAIMLLGALGAGFLIGVLGGNEVSVTMNTQGTRLFQIFGIGIMIWSFISSEFAYWVFASYTGGTVGLILTLLFSTIYTILTVMFFLGMYWRLFSFD